MSGWGGREGGPGGQCAVCSVRIQVSGFSASEGVVVRVFASVFCFCACVCVRVGTSLSAAVSLRTNRGGSRETASDGQLTGY